MGREALKLNYWKSVGAGLLLAICTGGGLARAGSSSFDQFKEKSEQLEHVQHSDIILIVIAVLILLGFALAVSYAVRLLLLNPLQVGCRHFFHENIYGPAEIGETGYGFSHGYGRNVMTMLLSDLFIFLWGLLLIVPGIIKSYSYRMVPYILEAEPGLSPTEVIDRSRQLMDGQKMNAFILDLSFIGWYLLAAITMGLAGVFYVFPYKAGTDAALYDAVRRDYDERFGQA